MTLLALDGEIIHMKNMRISADMQFQEQDMSGQTSATASSEQGAKAKSLTVAGLVPFKDKKSLARLFELAQAREGSQRKIYRVGSRLASTLKIREAKFCSRIDATEQENLMAWQVRFTLREHLSVPERLEQRQGKPAAIVGQSSTDTSAAGPAETAPADTVPEEVKLSRVEQFLKWADEALA